MTEKKPLYIDNKYFAVIFERDYDIPSYTICSRDFYGPHFFGAFDYKYNEKAPQYIAVQNTVGGWTLYNYKGYKMKGARNVQSIEWNETSYTVEDKGKKQTYSFKEVEKELSRFKLAVFGGIVAISALTSLFCFSQLGKQTKQPASQVQKITDQKKMSPQDTSRGSREN